ncbi:acyl carrier protein [Rhizobium paknamense]|uniref:Acyl carrier protein n=1 Tax=Rhizobium paknamense TaxID=1206817 RepID=A0ABU0IJC1_9HYPH|nr:acyl carrier protein [Rhizobium paknamense]
MVTGFISPERAIEPDDFLPDLGPDAVGTVEVFVALEGALGLRFPDKALSVEYFDSVTHILRLVSQVRAATSAAP